MTMRAGTRAKDRQGEPDPGHFERFCREIVPGILTDVCHVDKELAAQVGVDTLARAESYAALDDTARNVLISPFAEEVAGYEPAGSSLDLKGAVSVVVRSSLLEEAHSHGPVEAGRHRGHHHHGCGTAVALPGRSAPVPGDGEGQLGRGPD